jgi:hypothetical protein
MLGRMGLKQDAARPTGPAGAPGDLVEKLVSPFTGTEITA